MSAAEARELVRRAFAAAGRHNLGLISAGVAFFAVLALFPALAATVALFGLVGDPKDVANLLDAVRGSVPAPVITLARDQMDRLVTADGNRLVVHGGVSLAIALWSAQQGARSFLRALTIVHERGRRRKFVKRYLAGSAMTFAALLLAIVTIFAFTLAPLLLKSLGVNAPLLLDLVRWPVLLLLTTGFAFALYRWGPNRRPPGWRWLAPGAVFASIVWLAVSALFSVYVDLVTPLRALYGVFSGVFVLMFWLFLSAWIFLLGAEINAQLEELCASKSPSECAPSAEAS